MLTNSIFNGLLHNLLCVRTFDSNLFLQLITLTVTQETTIKSLNRYLTRQLDNCLCILLQTLLEFINENWTKYYWNIRHNNSNHTLFRRWPSHDSLTLLFRTVPASLWRHRRRHLPQFLHRLHHFRQDFAVLVLYFPSKFTKVLFIRVFPILYWILQIRLISWIRMEYEPVKHNWRLLKAFLSLSQLAL